VDCQCHEQVSNKVRQVAFLLSKVLQCCNYEKSEWVSYQKRNIWHHKICAFVKEKEASSLVDINDSTEFYQHMITIQSCTSTWSQAICAYRSINFLSVWQTFLIF